jgi:competence protein ComFC
MSFWNKVKAFIKKFFFNSKWTCNVCGREIFDGKYFCEDCENTFPFNDGPICNHCGRKVVANTNYCLTCRDRLLSIDCARSVFVYDEPISQLIKGAKYDGKKYLLEIFVDYLSTVYAKNFLKADCLTYIPMTENALNKRGYNQSEVMCRLLGQKLGVPTIDCLVKTTDTDRQATLNRKGRIDNLKGVFKVNDKKLVKDKSIVIIDDVTTTGATAEVVAKQLKRSGAREVYLLTVASVTSKDGY